MKNETQIMQKNWNFAIAFIGRIIPLFIRRDGRSSRVSRRTTRRISSRSKKDEFFSGNLDQILMRVPRILKNSAIVVKILKINSFLKN